MKKMITAISIIVIATAGLTASTKLQGLQTTITEPESIPVVEQVTEPTMIPKEESPVVETPVTPPAPVVKPKKVWTAKDVPVASEMTAEEKADYMDYFINRGAPTKTTEPTSGSAEIIDLKIVQ